MRLTKTYSRSGYFWLPSLDAAKVPGILTITDGGDIELEVVGLLGDVQSALMGDGKLGRIVGHIEKDGLVTLDGCFYRKRAVAFGSIAKSLVRASTAFIGVGYEQDEETTFNKFHFSVEGLDEWVGITGIKLTYGIDMRSVNIAYEPLEEITFDLEGDLRLRISFGWTLPGPSLTEAKVTHRTYFQILSDQARPLRDFQSYAHKLTNLVCFASDETVSLQDVSVTSDDISREGGNGKFYPAPIKVFYQSLPFAKNKPRIDSHSMLFKFGQIKHDASRILRNWLSACHEVEPAMNLYFAAKTGAHRYLEGRFLSLAQAIETYHRRTSSERLWDESEFNALVEELVDTCRDDRKDWLYGRLRHGNEISLGTRVKRIIEPFKGKFGTAKDRNRLIRDIVDTRNYLTHFDPSLADRAAGGQQLWVLCTRLEAIIQLHFLQALGFTSDEINAISSEGSKLQQKIAGV